MKLVLGLLIAAVAIAYFSHRASIAMHKQGTKAAVPITNVSSLLDEPTRSGPSIRSPLQTRTGWRA
jgi:hypothetical protein